MRSKPSQLTLIDIRPDTISGSRTRSAKAQGYALESILKCISNIHPCALAHRSLSSSSDFYSLALLFRVRHHCLSPSPIEPASSLGRALYFESWIHLRARALAE
jgi:hypothetical protein